MANTHFTRAVLLLGALLLAAFPLIGSTFYIQLGAKIMIMAIFAMSLDLLVGHTGLVSLGHAAYFGLAAYMLALITPKYEAASLWLTLPVAIVAAAAAALVIGFLVVRTGGVYFIMVTLAFAQMLYSLFHDTKLGGGSDGIYINIRPELTVGSIKPLDLEDPVQFYYLVLMFMLGVYAFLNKLRCAPFGRALAGIRANENRMRSIGYPVFGYKAGRRPGWIGRLSRRLPVRLRQPGNSRVASVRHGAHDGDSRRHGQVPRRDHRRVCLHPAARVALGLGHVRRLRQTLAARHGQLDRADRPGSAAGTCRSSRIRRRRVRTPAHARCGVSCK